MMTDLRAVSTSAEDYLEAILRLVAEKGAARVRDIAAALSVHKSTVSATLKGLAEKGLVNYSRYEITTLTTRGAEIAQEVQRRHEILGHFLVEVLGVSAEAAQANACRMEHVVDAEVLDRLALLVDFARQRPATDDDWARRFQRYSQARPRNRDRRAERPPQPPTDRHDRGPRLRAAGKEDAKVTSTLDRLRPGTKATIVKVGGRGAIRRRMVDMGMVAGTAVEVIKVAPLGDPLEVKIRGYLLSLRKNEAATVTVELS